MNKDLIAAIDVLNVYLGRVEAGLNAGLSKAQFLDIKAELLKALKASWLVNHE